MTSRDRTESKKILEVIRLLEDGSTEVIGRINPSPTQIGVSLPEGQNCVIFRTHNKELLIKQNGDMVVKGFRMKDSGALYKFFVAWAQAWVHSRS